MEILQSKYKTVSKKKKKKVIMFIDRDKRNTVTEVKIVK